MEYVKFHHRDENSQSLRINSDGSMRLRLQCVILVGRTHTGVQWHVSNYGDDLTARMRDTCSTQRHATGRFGGKRCASRACYNCPTSEMILYLYLLISEIHHFVWSSRTCVYRAFLLQKKEKLEIELKHTEEVSQERSVTVGNLRNELLTAQDQLKALDAQMTKDREKLLKLREDKRILLDKVAFLLSKSGRRCPSLNASLSKLRSFFG